MDGIEKCLYVVLGNILNKLSEKRVCEVFVVCVFLEERLVWRILVFYGKSSFL